MKILIAFRHRKAVEPYVDVAQKLRDRGHDVVVAVHERDEKVRGLFQQGEGLEFITLSDVRRDSWDVPASLARRLRDVVQYLREPYRDASKLRRRVYDRLLQELAVPEGVIREWSADSWLQLGPDAVARLEQALAHLERAIPADEKVLKSLQWIAPDLVLMTPLLHFGSTQVEIVKAAQALGIPVGMLLFSWDNLSTKGALHAPPDHLFVWNDLQREEAHALHGYPPDRVSTTGAPRFDRFFRLTSCVSHDAFLEPLGAGRDTAVVLYLCSSRLVSEKEVNFLRQWVRAVRRSPSTRLRQALLLVRPHPDLPLARGKWLSPERTFRWATLEGAELRVQTLFGDDRVLTLSSDRAPQQVLYESIEHSHAVVGLNTSAEIEAAIVGRPVFTILTDREYADGQHTTLHFHYLTAANGGFVTVAASLEEHVAQLGAELDAPTQPGVWRSRAESFVRPHGWDRPASDLLVEEVERVFGGSRRPAQVPAAASPAREALRLQPPSAPGRARLASFGPETFRRVTDGTTEIWVIGEDGAGDGEAMAPGTAEALAWLDGRLGPGAVVYDLHAGTGVFAVASARRFGCVVVALEANLVAIGRIWQHAVLNGCDGLVVPLCVRAGSESVLRRECYDRFSPEPQQRPLRARRWREHQPPGGAEIIQPVMTVPVDWIVNRWKLPVPTAVRASLVDDPDETLAAIESMLAGPGLGLVVLEGPRARLGASAERFAGRGFAAAFGPTAQDVLGLVRTGRPAGRGDARR